MQPAIEPFAADNDNGSVLKTQRLSAEWNNFDEDVKCRGQKKCDQEKGVLNLQQKFQSRLMESRCIGITPQPFPGPPSF